MEGSPRSENDPSEEEKFRIAKAAILEVLLKLSNEFRSKAGLSLKDILHDDQFAASIYDHVDDELRSQGIELDSLDLIELVMQIEDGDSPDDPNNEGGTGVREPRRPYPGLRKRRHRSASRTWPGLRALLGRFDFVTKSISLANKKLHNMIIPRSCKELFVEAANYPEFYEQENGDPADLEVVLTDAGTAETEAEVLELPVDPDAVLRSVLQYLGFKDRRLEEKIDDLRSDPKKRRQLLATYQDEALAHQNK